LDGKGVGGYNAQSLLHIKTHGLPRNRKLIPSQFQGNMTGSYFCCYHSFNLAP